MSTIRDPQNRLRHPAGAPASIGGRFATEAAPDAAADLEQFHAVATDEFGVDLQSRQRSHAVLAGLDYVPPASQPSATDPRTAAGIERWHAQARATAEYDTSNDAVALMPDDFGSATEGRSFRALRRTPRRLYTSGDGDLAVRMYATSRIRAYAAENGEGVPFDVPVEIKVGDRTVSGHVRVVPHGRGTYTAQPLNFPADVSTDAANAVTAILEARRPTRALKERADIAARHRAMLESAGVMLKPVERSSFITRVGYNRAAQQAVVEIDSTLGPTKYLYEGITPDEWSSFRRAESIGAAYNGIVKRRHGVARGSIRELATCPSCQAVHVADRAHTCLARATNARGAARSDRMEIAALQQWVAQRDTLGL